ncbi:MAG: hypothetical protein MRY63_08490 [Neomegalonema sp.]|nr:hypothetical protein [Neomegalonema sp.]
MRITRGDLVMLALALLTLALVLPMALRQATALWAPVPAAVLEPSAPRSLETAAPSGSEAAAPGMPDAFTEQIIAARPLFTPGRQPASRGEEPAESPSPQPLPPPQVTVQGILLGSDGAVALLKRDAGAPLRARAGDVIAGWRITQITPSGITLSHEERSLHFSLRGGDTAPGPRPPAATVPGGPGMNRVLEGLPAQ